MLGTSTVKADLSLKYSQGKAPFAKSGICMFGVFIYLKLWDAWPIYTWMVQSFVTAHISKGYGSTPFHPLESAASTQKESQKGNGLLDPCLFCPLTLWSVLSALTLVFSKPTPLLLFSVSREKHKGFSATEEPWDASRNQTSNCTFSWHWSSLEMVLRAKKHWLLLGC